MLNSDYEKVIKEYKKEKEKKLEYDTNKETLSLLELKKKKLEQEEQVKNYLNLLKEIKENEEKIKSLHVAVYDYDDSELEEYMLRCASAYYCVTKSTYNVYVYGGQYSNNNGSPQMVYLGNDYRQRYHDYYNIETDKRSSYYAGDEEREFIKENVIIWLSKYDAFAFHNKVRNEFFKNLILYGQEKAMEMIIDKYEPKQKDKLKRILVKE